jgi:hypothetical protein
MALLTGKEYRKRNRERAIKWRNSLKEKGFKNFNMMLSPRVQKVIESIKKGTKLSNAEAIEAIVEENQQLKKQLAKSKQKKS